MSRQGCRSTRGQLRCPRIPRAAPPTLPHTHTRGGSRPGPQAAGLGPPRWGSSTQQGFETQRKELVSSNKNTLLKVCLGYGGAGVDRGVYRMELSCPWTTSIHLLFPLKRTRSDTPRVCLLERGGQRLSADGCLLGPRVLEGGRVTGEWGGVKLLCFESCAALSSNGKGSEWAGDVKARWRKT